MRINKILKYIFIFCFFFISLVFAFTLFRGDTFVNFGFSYAIRSGEIPYKDFNMVISPFAPYFYSIGLIFSKDIIFYYIFQSFLLTIMFYLVEKMLNKKSILFLLCIMIPYPVAMVSTLFPGYNFLLFLLFLIFIYCFRMGNSDYLLGIILGLIFCTKQTIGLILFLPSLYYLFKDKKKFIKIFVGYLIPCILLLGYLITFGNLKQFVDLCFLGLFSFGNQNTQIDIFYFILFIIGFIYLLFRIIKDNSNILLYYALLFSSVSFPIVDYYHVSLFLLIVCYFFIENISNYSERVNKYLCFISLSICIIWSTINIFYLKDITVHNYHNFSLSITGKSYMKRINQLSKYLDTLDEEIIYFMRGSENYFFKIMNDQKITYFDLPNYGNYGYDGIEMMKEKIDSKHNVYFVLDSVLLNNNDNNQQYIKELGNYIVQSSTKKKSFGIYDVYYKK